MNQLLQNLQQFKQTFMENKAQVIIYQSTKGDVQLEVKLKEETVWRTQNQIVALINGRRVNVAEYINNVFNEGKLNRDASSRKFRLVRKEGNREVGRNIAHFF